MVFVSYWAHFTSNLLGFEGSVLLQVASICVFFSAFSICLHSNCHYLPATGRFLGELTKQVFSDLAASKYQVLFHLHQRFASLFLYLFGTPPQSSQSVYISVSCGLWWSCWTVYGPKSRFSWSVDICLAHFILYKFVWMIIQREGRVWSIFFCLDVRLGKEGREILHKCSSYMFKIYTF